MCRLQYHWNCLASLQVGGKSPRVQPLAHLGSFKVLGELGFAIPAGVSQKVWINGYRWASVSIIFSQRFSLSSWHLGSLRICFPPWFHPSLSFHIHPTVSENFKCMQNVNFPEHVYLWPHTWMPASAYLGFATLLLATVPTSPLSVYCFINFLALCHLIILLLNF